MGNLSAEVDAKQFAAPAGFHEKRVTQSPREVLSTPQGVLIASPAAACAQDTSKRASQNVIRSNKHIAPRPMAQPSSQP